MLTTTHQKPGLLKSLPKSFLSAFRMFKNIPDSILREAEKEASQKRYAKGVSLFLEDDAAECLWFVQEGFVKEMIHSVEGRSFTLSLAGPGGMVGTGSFVGGGYGCHAVAETDATVVAFPIRIFQDLMGKCPGMAREVVAQISRLLRQSKDMQTFAQESVEKRILHVLAGLAEEFGNTIPLTRREIAEMAGTTVETCIRTFSRLGEEGLVSTGRGKIILRNAKDLAERIQQI